MALAFLLALPAVAATTSGPIQHSPNEVLLVINSNSPTSQAVGAYYQQARGISNVVYVQCEDSAVSSDNESIDFPDFNMEIATPISNYVATHTGINFIVLTKGIPLVITNTTFGSGYTFTSGNPSVDSYLAALNYSHVVGARETTVDDRYSPNAIGHAWTNRYYNATVPFTHAKFGGYLVTRLDGYTQANAEALVNRALAAEAGIGSGPILLDIEPDFGLNATGNPLMNDFPFYNANMVNIGNILQASGVPCNDDISTTFAGNLSNLLGYFSFGSNDDHFSLEAFDSLKFAPGAIGDTAVSTGARTMLGTPGSWYPNGQSLIADLVANGMTGVEGYVREPVIYVSSPTIDLTHYLSGYTLAESFYAGNQLLAWEGVILGDPLCCPYLGSDPALVTPTRASAYRLASRGIEKVVCAEGQYDVANTAAGTYLFYPVDYTDSSQSIIARVSSTNSGSASIAIHLDTPTGTLVGTLTVPPTGDPQSWTNVTTSLPPITGVHRFYLVFSSANVSLEWFAFSAGQLSQ